MRFSLLFFLILLVGCHTTKTAQHRKQPHRTYKTSKVSKSKAPTASVAVQGKGNGVASYYHDKFNGRKQPVEKSLVITSSLPLTALTPLVLPLE